MKRSTVAIVIIVIAALIVGGVIALSGDSNDSDNTNSTTPTTDSQTQNPQPDTSQNAEEQTGQNVITYNGNSFSPGSLTVSSGTTVTIKNTSSEELEFNSDVHPVHTDNSELNVGAVAAGGSRTFTVNTKGTFGYHNHLDPNQTGTIVVQ